MTTPLPELLTARAAEDPQHVCLIQGDDPAAAGLTTERWDRESATVARALLALGVGRGERVVLSFDGREWTDLAVAWMGVLRAGAVAVPLPPSAPDERIASIIVHAGARIAVGGRAGTGSSMTWHSLPSLRRESGDARPLPVLMADDPAQILYTSGTTGAPKGVLVHHGDLGGDDRSRRRALAHSTAFLFAFPVASNAGQTMLAQAVTAHATGWALARFDGPDVCRLIDRCDIGTIFLVPAMAVDLLDAPQLTAMTADKVHLIGSTAAPLPPAVARGLVKAFPRATVVNTYTTTEAAPSQTVMIVDPERPGSLGRPTRSGDLRITDANMRPVEPGRVGAVWLRGSGRPRAYLHDAEASAHTFVNGWVRTGDRGRIDADGHLYLVDREDDVIVSGGVNVSSLAVEAALLEHPAVRAAAVVGERSRSLGEVVVAAVETRTKVDPRTLREFLIDHLARHELPTRIVVTELPRTQAGKLDKRALRVLLADEVATRPAGPPPRTPVERVLAEIWSVVLRVPEPSVDDDFFALGGDSFTAARAAAQASGRFGIEIPAHLPFLQPLLGLQASWIAKHAADAPMRSTASEAEVAPGSLSALQEYFLRWMHQTVPPRVVSAITVAVEVHEPLDVDALTQAFGVLAERHDALRTVFRPDDAGRFYAIVRDDLPLDVRRIALPVSANDSRVDAWIAGQLDGSFDVAEGPLARLMVVELAPELAIVVLAVHHLVVDGWSMGILLRDLGRAYRAQVRPPGEQVRGSRASELTAFGRRQWEDAAPYWDHVLAGAPSGYEYVPGRRYATEMVGASMPFAIPDSLARAMRDAANRAQVTMHGFVLACWSAMLAGLCGTDDMVLMSPVPGRSSAEHDEVVACAVQSLLLRVDCPPDLPILDHVRAVQRVLSDAQRHQHYRYEEAARRIPYPAWVRYERWASPAHLPGLDSGPHPVARELMFTWPLVPGEHDAGVPELALTESRTGSIEGWLVYNARAFDLSTVKRFAEHFKRLCDVAAHEPRTLLADLGTALSHPEGISR